MKQIIAITVVLFSITFSQITQSIKVSAVNPRYIVSTLDTMKAIFFGGDHIWGGLHDGSRTYPPAIVDQSNNLWDTLSNNHLNFTKLWIWREAGGVPEYSGNWWWSPEVYVRTGPGNASDGRLKFNLDLLNPAFLNRLHSYCDSLRKRNIYAVVMLANGWDNSQYYQSSGNPWTYHPYDIDNNINNANGDVNNNGQGEELYYTPADGANSIAYTKLMNSCKKIVESVNDLPNVIFETVVEISSNGNQKYRFLRALTDSVKKWEMILPQKHLLLNGGAWDINNDSLFALAGNIVAPGGNPSATYWDDTPRDMLGEKVVIVDSDHLWGMISDDQTSWVWKCFMTGQGGVVLQDNFCANPEYPAWDCNNSSWPAFRRAMGQAIQLAKDINLLRMNPSNLSSTSAYEMASDSEIVIYQSSGTISVNLSSYDSMNVKWYSASSFQTAIGSRIAGGTIVNLTPLSSIYDVVYLSGRTSGGTPPPPDTTTPPPVSVDYIYRENSLAGSWNDIHSRRITRTYNNTTPVYQGNTSAKLVHNAGGALQFAQGSWCGFTNIDPKKYSNLTFAVHGGKSGVTLSVSGINQFQSNIKTPVSVTVPANTWQVKSIPMAQLSSVPFMAIYITCITPTVTFYMDDIGLTYAATHNSLMEANKSNEDLQFKLEQNYPNPFNPATTIRYYLPVRANVILEIYNILGERVDVVTNGIAESGNHEVLWNAGNAPSGIYFCKLSVMNGDTRTNISVKMMYLLK